jgi:transcription elongation factor GreB
MSKAFTNEDDAGPPPIVAPRAPLPPGVPNYVTERGLRLLREELEVLRGERARVERDLADASDTDRAQALAAIQDRRAALEERIASAELVPPLDETTDVVRFGVTVTVEGQDGARRYRIVGVDESDPASGSIAFVSPLARALMGCAVGDVVRHRAPRGEEELEIVAVEYADDA